MFDESVEIDPLDPLFISYRQSDGTDITAEVAWLLRSAGLPVWRDRDDLPPGDTVQRLEQAISDGVSGAVMVITPQIEKSDVVRRVEAPKLIALHASHPAFALGIVNDVKRKGGSLDYQAPDRLLQRDPPDLQGVDQHGTSRAELVETVRKMAFHRVAQFRSLVAAGSGTFRISIQTRNTPQVYDRTDSHLDVRVRRSNHERLPSAEGLRDLMDTIGLLPDSVTRTGAQRAAISGGAHLSVAIALGAALPSSRVGQIEVIDQRGASWLSGHEASFGSDHLIKVIAEHRQEHAIVKRPAVAIYVDIMETPSPRAFERFIEERGGDLVAWRHIGLAPAGLIDSSSAAELAAQLGAHIRKVSTENGNAEVHLLYRGPFPMAVLIGRLTNTLRLVVHEWDDSGQPAGTDWRPRYVPTLRISASAGGGVIQEVLLSPEQESADGVQALGLIGSALRRLRRLFGSTAN